MQRELFWQKIERAFKGRLKGKKIAVWGLSFKPKTDDIREAPSLYVIDRLLSAGVEVTVHDPVAMDKAREIYGKKIEYADRKSTRLNSSHMSESRMPSSA